MPPARPEGWGRDYVLSRLENLQGMKSLCEEAAEGLPVKWSTLYQEVRGWRNQDARLRAELRKIGETPEDELPRFDELYAFFMEKICGRSGQGGGGSYKLEDWWGKWFELFVLNRGRPIEACEQLKELHGIEISWGYISNMRKEGHPSFSKEFVDLYSEAMSHAVGMNFDTTQQIIHDPSVDPRTRANTAIQVNERLDRENWGRTLNMKHSGTVTHQQAIEGGTLKFLEAVLNRFPEKPAQLPPAPSVEVEAEVVDA